MTLVRIALDVPGPTGNVRATGSVRATPTRRRTVGDTVVLPAPVEATLVNGVATLDLAATSADWAWRIDERTFYASTTRWVAVPESGTTIGYEDLTVVDPNTLDPTVEPEAAWTVALAAALTTVVHSVGVDTGSEARPDTTATVIWYDNRVDQSTPPTNIVQGDVWLTGVVPDVTAPTVPTDLASSAITDTGFTLDWTASTDAVGVTGYRVLLDGVQYTLPTGTTQAVTGRTASTAYDVTVQARDAAGNWSAESDVLIVTTAAGSSFPTHTIFNTPPGVLTKTVEAEPYENATAFYTYTATPTGWKVKGARLYVPDGVTVPATCEVNLYTTAGVPPTLGTPTKTATMTGIVSNAWNTVDFPSVTEVAPGTVWWIGIKFADGTWMGVEALTADFVQSFDGSNFVLADRVPDVGLDRNYRRIGTGSTVALTGTGDRDLWFGMDATLEED